VKYRKPVPERVTYDSELTLSGATLPAVYEGYLMWYVMAMSYMDAGQMDRMGAAQAKAAAQLDINILAQLKGRPNRPFRRGYM